MLHIFYEQLSQNISVRDIKQTDLIQAQRYTLTIRPLSPVHDDINNMSYYG